MKPGIAFWISLLICWSVGCSSSSTPSASSPPSSETRLAQGTSPKASPEPTQGAPPSQGTPAETNVSSPPGETPKPPSTGNQASTPPTEDQKARPSAVQPTEAPSPIALAPSPPQSLLLRLNLKPGSTFRYETTVKTESAGTPMPSMKIITKVTVKQATREGFLLAQVIEEAKTEGESSAPSTGLLKNLQNLRMEVEVNKQGKVIKQNFQSEDPSMRRALQNFGVPGRSLSPIGVTFPAKPVQVGTRWSEKLNLAQTLSETFKAFGASSPQSIDAKFDVKKDEASYLVKGIHKRGAQTVVVIEVNLSADVTMTLQPPPNAQTQQPLSGALKLTGSGTMEISADTGTILSSTMDATVENSWGTFATKQKTKTETRLLP